MISPGAVAPCIEGSCGSGDDGQKDAFIARHDYTGTGSTNPAHCPGNLNDIDSELDDEGGWSTSTASNSQGSDWTDSGQGGQDDSYVDARDIAYFCGLGGQTSGKSYLNFDQVLLGVPLTIRVEAPDVNWGNVDLEWVILDTPHSLYGTATDMDNWDDWHAGFQFLHMIIGWHDNPTDTDTGFQFFDEMLDTGAFDGGGHQIDTAFFDDFGGCNGQSNKKQVIIAETEGQYDDFIHGESTGATADATNDGVYFYKLNTC